MIMTVIAWQRPEGLGLGMLGLGMGFGAIDKVNLDISIYLNACNHHLIDVATLTGVAHDDVIK